MLAALRFWGSAAQTIVKLMMIVARSDATNMPAITRQRIRIDFFKGFPPFSAALFGVIHPFPCYSKAAKKANCFLRFQILFTTDML